MFGLAELALHAGPTDIVCGPWISDVSQTSFTVSWLTEGDVLSWVEAGEDDGCVFYASQKQKYYQTVAGKRMTGAKHSVTVSGLKPGTKYVYRLCGKRVAEVSEAYHMRYGSQHATREKYTVRTLDHNAQACRFAIVSDVHGRDEHFKSLITGLEPDSLDFFVVNGDLVSKIYDIDKTTRHAVDPIKPLVANLPYMYVRGNHEGRGNAHYLLTDIFPMREKDGWYYYNKPLANGETTDPLFKGVTLAGREMDNKYQNKDVVVSVSAQAGQTANNGESVLAATGWPNT